MSSLSNKIQVIWKLLFMLMWDTNNVAHVILVPGSGN